MNISLSSEINSIVRLFGILPLLNVLNSIIFRLVELVGTKCPTPVDFQQNFESLIPTFYSKDPLHSPFGVYIFPPTTNLKLSIR